MRTIVSQSRGRLFLVKLLLFMMIPVVVITGCTRYQPLGQGSRVPWAKALSADRGGPIDDRHYRVGEGDALSVIAERYGLRLAALAAANNIQSPYVLYPGEVLRIPAATVYPEEPVRAQSTAPIRQTALPEPRREPSAANATPRWEPRPRADRTTVRPLARPEQPGKRYIVDRGDSLSVIAERHGLSLGELAAANGLRPPFKIRPGQDLVIPATETEHRRQAEAKPPVERPLAPPPPLSAEGFLWPVRGEVIGTFEQNSATGRSGGITIRARRGTPVRAADNGIVAYAGEALKGYGQMILIRHADGYVTLYAHNDVLLAGEGQVVRRGQPIAEVGSSGDVIDSQLHFELRKGSEPIDPTKILAGLPGREVGRLETF